MKNIRFLIVAYALCFAVLSCERDKEQESMLAEEEGASKEKEEPGKGGRGGIHTYGGRAE